MATVWPAVETILEHHYGMRVTGTRLLDSSDDTHFAVTTGSARHVVTVHAEGKCRRAIDSRLDIAVRLAGRGIPVPPVVETTDGRLSVASGGLVVSVSSYVDGAELAAAPLAPGDVGAVAALLARVHAAGVVADVNSHDCWPVEPLDTVRREWLSRLAEPDRPMAARAADLLAGVRWDDLPRGLVHGDLHRRNVLRDGSGRLWIIDLACASHDTLVKDLAVFIAMFCADIAERAHPLDLLTAAADAYHAVRPLESAERAALPALVAAVYLVYLVELSSGLDAADPQRWLSFCRRNLAATLGLSYPGA